MPGSDVPSRAMSLLLADFISQFEYAVMMLLDRSPEDAFAGWPAGE